MQSSEQSKASSFKLSPVPLGHFEVMTELNIFALLAPGATLKASFVYPRF